jgi:hypothetical protein
MRRFASFVNCFKVSPVCLFPLNPGISWKWTENSLFWVEYLSVLCLKVSIYQFCRKQLTKLANLLMHSQCALSGPIYLDFNLLLTNTLIKINYSLWCHDSRERGKGDWHWLFTKNHFDIDCLYHRQGNEQKQVAVHQI